MDALNAQKLRSLPDKEERVFKALDSGSEPHISQVGGQWWMDGWMDD